MNRQAQKIRETADREAVAAVIAAFPASDEIPPREVFSPDAALDKLASEPERRAEQLAERLEAWTEQLQKHVQRYESLKGCGLEALSDYDLAIAHGGDAVAAIYGALKFKTAHISYARAALLLVMVEQATTAAALEAARPQLALF